MCGTVYFIYLVHKHVCLRGALWVMRCEGPECSHRCVEQSISFSWFSNRYAAARIFGDCDARMMSAVTGVWNSLFLLVGSQTGMSPRGYLEIAKRGC